MLELPRLRTFRSSIGAVLASLWLVRDATWLNGWRARAYSGGLLVALGIAAIYLTATGGGFAFAADFRSYWAASMLALQGHPEAAYGADAEFIYPPIYLLICLPLALLPFAAAAAVWTATTAALFVASMRRLIPKSDWMIAAAFPAAWFNIAGAQNGFLTAGLLISGLRSIEARPILAGALLGCLAFKPQLGMVLPFVLLAARRWRAAASAGVTGLALVAASIAAFGSAPWAAFLQSIPFSRLAAGVTDGGHEKMASVAGAALLLGAPGFAAAAIQLAATIATCSFLARLAGRCRDPMSLAAATCVGAGLASPWLHYYDLTILALPIAWLAIAGARTGSRPWERIILLLAYLLPFIGMPLAFAASISIAPWLLAALLGLIAGRCLTETGR